MFGYIVTNEELLNDEQKKTYHSYYCGLCHCLKEDYSLSSTRLHSNDMTFLELLLSGLYEPTHIVSQRNCMLHPFKKHTSLFNQYDHYCADMTILLAYYKAQDDYLDEGKHQRRFKDLSKKMIRLKKKYPDKIMVIEDSLNLIHQAEQQKCQDLDYMANTFGKVLGEVFRFENDVWQDELYTIGDNLGRFIYLMDAYDDIEEDLKKHTYNPFIEKYHREDFNDYVEKILTIYISEATLAFERLPILENSDILRNILYSGIWSKFESVKKKRNEEK